MRSDTLPSITPAVNPPSAALRLLVAASGIALCAFPRTADAPESAPSPARAPRPLAFERNDGQTDSRVRFVARGSGGAVFVTDDGLTLASRRGTPLSMEFDGAIAREVSGAQRLPGHVNYLKGNDPSRWLRGVPLFARAVCENVWPGVDVVFHGDGGLVEYDFEVAPGADVSAIGLRFDGADSVTVDDGGALVVRRGDDEYRHLRPHVLQDGHEIGGAFEVAPDGRVGFGVAGRDRTRALVIDPVIAYATYLGGSDSEAAFVLSSIPSDFPQAQLRLRLALGVEIPARVELYEFAPMVLDRIPKLADFRFVVTEDQLVVVAPPRSQRRPCSGPLELAEGGIDPGPEEFPPLCKCSWRRRITGAGHLNRGTSEKARQMVHASTCPSQLYGCEDRVTLDELVKINICG